MSDKKNINIQDQGWNAMRSVLNIELPEKKKRRFALWMFLGGATIGIFALIGVLNHQDNSVIASRIGESSLLLNDVENSIAAKVKPTFQNTEIELNKELQHPQIPSANEPKPSLNSIQNSHQNVIPNVKNEIKNNAVALKSKVEIGSLITNKSIDDKSIKQTNTVLYPVKNQGLRNIGVLSKGENKDLNPSKSQTPEEKILNIEPIEDIGPIEDKSKRKRILIPMIDMPLNNYLPVKSDYPSYAWNNPMVKIKRNYGFSTYLFASSSYQHNNNGLGYGVGGGLNYGNNSTELYFEIGYHKLTYNSGALSNNFSPFANIEVLDDDNFEGSTIIPSGSYDLSVSNFQELTTSTDEIKLTLGMRKEIFNRLNLNFGISYAKLLNATNKSLSVELNNAANLFDLGKVNVVSTELYDSGAYSTFDIVPHFGVEYSLTSNINIGLKYNYGLRNLITDTSLDRLTSISENDAIYRRNFTAKFRYQF